MIFNWQAQNNKGELIRGQIDAATPRDARQQLRDKGLIPLALEQKKASAFQRSPGTRIKIKSADLALFTRQLATLTTAALPLEEALAVIAKQNKGKRIGQVVEAIREQVISGHTLADALAAWPRVFDSIYRTLVKAGEKGGLLGPVLEKLADYNELREQLRAKLTQALIYPTMLTLVAIGVVTILLTTVVPKVVEQFIHMKQQLPLTTRSLLAISDALRNYGPWFLAAVFAVSVAFHFWLRPTANRFRFHQKLLSVILCGNLIRAVNSARYLRTLSILESSGVPLLDGMNVSLEGINNLAVREALKEASNKVQQGNSFHAALEQTDLFPPMMLYMIASGEKSGQLSSLMARAADNQDTQLQNRIAFVLALFEPALIISMACIVLFIVASVMQPILQLNTLIS